MKYGSVCSGIEAATVAWHEIGWTPAWFSEIAAFPSAVLQHHYPDVANIGDMKNITDLLYSGQIEAPDVLCGGTPCQAFSIAGLRQSLNDDRGNLSLLFCEVANAIDNVRTERGELPAIIIWENVPGVFSTNDNAFGCFLAGIIGESEPIVPTGKKWANAGIIVGSTRNAAWRVLDAQYFGLAQRRKRVFVVASARTDIDVGQILFDFDGVQRNTPPSREKTKTNTESIETSSRRNKQMTEQTNEISMKSYSISSMDSAGMRSSNPNVGFKETDISRTIDTTGTNPAKNQGGNVIVHQNNDDETIIPSHEISGTIVSSMYKGVGRATGLEIPLAMSFKVRGEGTVTGERGGNIKNLGQHGGSGMISYEEKTFTVSTSQDQYVAYTMREDATNNTFSVQETDVALTLQSTQPTINSHHAQMMIQDINSSTSNLRIRRLTPRECERLQGFPDDYTKIPYRGKTAEECPDSLRYQAIGNSWAIPVVSWLGKRINNLIAKNNVT